MMEFFNVFSRARVTGLPLVAGALAISSNFERTRGRPPAYTADSTISFQKFALGERGAHHQQGHILETLRRDFADDLDRTK